jgi:ribonuclease BN (tRNA processing enzyme)
MNITYLGTSSGMPTKERNVSCITLQLESGELLVFGFLFFFNFRLWRRYSTPISKITFENWKDFNHFCDPFAW